MHRDCPLDCKVYVGNLGNNGNKTELERSFGYYGPLRSVWVARNPPGFAFVEFEDPRDATDAVRELDGRNLCGCRVRVELSNGEKRSRARGAPPSWSRRPRDRDDYRRRSPPTRRRWPKLFGSGQLRQKSDSKPIHSTCVNYLCFSCLGIVQKTFLLFIHLWCLLWLRPPISSSFVLYILSR